MVNNERGPCSDGLLVIARSVRTEDRPRDAPLPAISLDPPTIAARFKGLSADRRAWPLEDVRIDALCGDGGRQDCGLIPLSGLHYVVQYYERAQSQLPCDLLYCQPLASWDEAELSERDDLSFRGYDYAYYLGADHHYSAVYNDILYGRYDELRVYAQQLNHDLLLPTLELAQDVHHARTELIQRHATLERGQSFIPIALFLPRLT